MTVEYMTALTTPQGILPDKFQEWRPGQLEAIDAARTCKSRILVQAIPTGFGKSAVYMTLANITGGRTLILTATKALQDQLQQEFGSKDVAIVKGQNAYPCAKSKDHSCASGPCKAGAKCPLKDKGCHYYDAVRAASLSKIVVTNFAYWLVMSLYPSGAAIGDFDNLIVDEAHSAPLLLLDKMTVTFSSEALALVGMSCQAFTNFTCWVEWLRLLESNTREVVEKMSRNARMVSLSPKRAHRVRLISELSLSVSFAMRFFREGWIARADRDCVQLAARTLRPELTEELLFRGIPRIHLTSATVTPTTMGIMGLHHSAYTLQDYGHLAFPVENRPVYSMSGPRITRKTTEDEYAYMVHLIDQIVKGRKDAHKGVIHTCSYRLQKIIYDRSEYSDIMRANQPHNTAEVVAKFKSTPIPSVLLSPSVSTGYDFPGDDCGFAIIVKVPFPNLGDPILRARMQEERARGKEALLNYITMQELIQAMGRGMRSADDTCEHFIVDGVFQTWFKKVRHLAPPWFSEAISFRHGASIPRRKV